MQGDFYLEKSNESSWIKLIMMSYFTLLSPPSVQLVNDSIPVNYTQSINLPLFSWDKNW